MINFSDLNILDINQGLRKKEFSAKELAEHFLLRIKKEDDKIFSFLRTTPELALSQAKKTDERISKGKDLPLLAGVPYAVKDVILVENVECTAGSKMLENYIAPYNAGVINKLNEQGAVVLGKTNLDEFAMGSSTENSAFGTTKNPHDLTRVPGGSSGGSAAALAAGFCTFSLGSDTGGSIRQPASFCGLVGLKPTYGAVSRHGLMAFGSSLDQIGPFAKNVADCRIIFNAIKGKDQMDSTSFEEKLEKSKTDIKNLRIGVPKEYFIKGMDEAVEKVIREVISKCEQLGAKIEEISLPHTEYALPVYYIIAPAEASANLARYDGIKYGFSKNSDSKIKDLIDIYLSSRGEGFGAEVRRRIMLGTYVLSSGYYDAYYIRALKVRTKIKEDFEKAFEKVDAIFTPVAPTPAFKIGEKTQDPLSMYLSDIFTISANLTGLPAISLPLGKVGSLPVGLQIIGKAFGEEKILDIAQILEKN